MAAEENLQAGNWDLAPGTRRGSCREVLSHDRGDERERRRVGHTGLFFPRVKPERSRMLA